MVDLERSLGNGPNQGGELAHPAALPTPIAPSLIQPPAIAFRLLSNSNRDTLTGFGHEHFE
jgi:hypothetical protein